MVTVPKNKILVSGKPGIAIKKGATLSLSAEICGELVLPTLHFEGSDLAVNPVMLELDSVGLRVISTAVDLFQEVFSLKPKDMRLEPDSPADINELRALLAEISFVRSLRKIHLLLDDSVGSCSIHCSVIFNKPGSMTLKKQLQISGSVSEDLGWFFEFNS